MAEVAKLPVKQVRRIQDVKFAGAILCGAKTESFVENKGSWGVEVDWTNRAVTVTRLDEYNRVNATTVPFENVLQIRYVMEEAAK